MCLRAGGHPGAELFGEAGDESYGVPAGDAPFRSVITSKPYMTYKKLHTPIQPAQSAVIPYRIRNTRPEVLLITTRNKGKWIVPKGWIEEDLTSHASAEKEALEEAGVQGEVSAVSLGCYRHGGSDDDPIVEVFLMRVERELRSWPEQEERTRRWVSLEEAYEHVEEQGLQSILDEAATLMHLALPEAAPDASAAPHPALPRRTAGDVR